MNQDTSQGNPEGATPSSGLDSPNVVDSICNCSSRKFVRHNLKPSSNALSDRAPSPLQFCTLPRRTLNRLTNTSATSAAVHNTATTALHRVALVPPNLRAAFPVPRVIYSVYLEPSNTAQGIQPTGRLGPPAPPAIPTAFAIRPPTHAPALTMNTLINAGSTIPMDRRFRPFQPSLPSDRASLLRGTPCPTQSTAPGAPPLRADSLPSVPRPPGPHSPHTGPHSPGRAHRWGHPPLAIPAPSTSFARLPPGVVALGHSEEESPAANLDRT